MVVIKMPRLFGGGPRTERVPSNDWDPEVDAMKAIGEWLATLPEDESKFRVLTYWMWRLKADKSPQISDWVDDVAEQSAADVAQRSGFDVAKKGG